MPKRRPNGDGMVRKRSDGRWEGRIIVGEKADGSYIFRSVFDTTQKGLVKKLHALIEEYDGKNLNEKSSITLS
jgi:hypothetical protein